LGGRRSIKKRSWSGAGRPGSPNWSSTAFVWLSCPLRPLAPNARSTRASRRVRFPRRDREKTRMVSPELPRWLWPSVRLMSTENGPPVLGQDHVVQSDPLVGEWLDPPDLGGKGRVELMGERQPFAPRDHANPLAAGLQSVSFWRAPDLHCLFPEFLGLGLAAHRVVEPRQVVQRGGVGRMPLAQGRDRK